MATLKQLLDALHESTETSTAEEIKALSGSDIADKFKEFCRQNDYSYNEGMEILKEVL